MRNLVSKGAPLVLVMRLAVDEMLVVVPLDVDELLVLFPVSVDKMLVSVSLAVGSFVGIFVGSEMLVCGPLVGEMLDLVLLGVGSRMLVLVSLGAGSGPPPPT